MKARKNISDNIYEVIKKDVILGNLNFGDSISEIFYAEKLNVSRTPLREAIKKLEIEGVIERLPNGRLRIIEITEKRIKEIMDIRISLENIILDSIINEDKDVTPLEKNLNLTKLYINTENWDEARKLFAEFNKLLYQISGLEFTVKIINQYEFLISTLRRDSLKNVDRVKLAYNEHIEIVKHLKNKELEKVKEINERHLQSSAENILEFFRKNYK